MGQPLWKINENIEKYNRVISYYVDSDDVYRTYKKGKGNRLQKLRLDLSTGKWRWFHRDVYYSIINSKLTITDKYGGRGKIELEEIPKHEAGKYIDTMKMLYELRR